MKFTSFLLLMALAVPIAISSCCKSCPKGSNTATITFKDFTTSEVSKLLITKYAINSYFNRAIDSFYVDSNAESVDDKIYINFPQELEVKYDWKVKAMLTDSDYYITNFVSEQRPCTPCRN